MFKFNSSLLAIFLLSGCSSDLVLSPPKQPDYKPMPDITQSVTPTQQRAIMAGERPDWSERTPVSAATHTITVAAAGNAENTVKNIAYNYIVRLA